MTWPSAKLKYVARLGYGDALPNNEPLEGAFRVFGSNGPFATYSRANTRAPAVIVGRKGSYGKVNWTTEPCFASDTTFYIDESTSRNHLRWIYWLLQTLQLDEGTDEAAVPGLNRETAYSKDVLLPPVPKQRAIAEYLDRETMQIDNLLAAKNQSIVLLKERRAALIDTVVTGQIDVEQVESSENHMVAFVGNQATWPSAKLKYVARLGYGDALPNDEPLEGAFRVFGSNGPFATYSRANTRAPAVIVGRKGSYGKVNWTTEPCFASDTTFYIDESTSRNHLRWIYWLLQTLQLDEGTDEAAVPGLNRETAYSKDVLLPPIPKQRAIAEYLDRETMQIDNLLAAKNQSIVLLKERRATLIDTVVTGQIDVGK